VPTHFPFLQARSQPSQRVCKPAYLVPVPSQDRLGGLCQEWHTAYKWWGDRDGAPISLDWVAVHLDCWCVYLCYLHFAPENPEYGEMYLLVPAHPGCPGQSPESCVSVCVCVYIYMVIII